MAKIKIGNRAPDFTLPAQNGENITLSTFFGKKNVVLFFYPRDEGPTCVKEAQVFRANYEAFVERSAQVVGVSSQSVESHKRFANHHKLQYILLSDQDNNVRKLYNVSSTLGVPGRATFVIDKEGIVKHIFVSQLRFTKHAKEALGALKELTSLTCTKIRQCS
jgi:thioredoxin-dependent peroxiredoxin